MFGWLKRLLPVREVEVFPPGYHGMVREHKDIVDDFMLAHYTLDRMGVPKNKDRKNLLHLHERIKRFEDDAKILVLAIQARYEGGTALVDLESILDELSVSRTDLQGLPLSLEQRLERVPSAYSAWVRLLLKEKESHATLQDSDGQ